MPKLIKHKYYKQTGEEGITGYSISIPKTIAEKVGFTDKDKLIVTDEKDKIIIEKEK